MGKINEKPLYAILGGLPKDMPFELIQEIASWDRHIKSPYGHSYYNEPVDWDTKPHNSLRIADHWNFTSQSKVHCQTSSPAPDNTHYTLAKYDAVIKLYVPIKSYTKLTTNVKQSLEYKLLRVDTLRLRAINCLAIEFDLDRNADFYLDRRELDYAELVFDVIQDFIK